jgi:nucleotide-binding universal stress UspA family protein
MTDSLLSRVLVPLDGSPNAEIILPQLRRLLPRHESALTLLQALPPLHETTEEEARRYLRALANRLTLGGIPSKDAVRHGLAAEAILEAAAEEQATLIALATRGRSGVGRWMLGSVAEKVLQSSLTPLLLARTPARWGLEAPPIRSILVPIDGTPEALDVLNPVLEFVRGVDARVRLLHVDEPTPYAGHWDSPDETVRKADHLLREACVPTTFEYRRGHPAEEILKSASENGVDLIAMTTHGRSGPPLWVKGSVAAEVLRATSVPLLVTRRHSPPTTADGQKTTGLADIPATSGPQL